MSDGKIVPIDKNKRLTADAVKEIEEHLEAFKKGEIVIKSIALCYVTKEGIPEFVTGGNRESITWSLELAKLDTCLKKAGDNPVDQESGDE